MLFTRVNTIAVKSCPSCAQELQISMVNGRERLVCFNCEFVHWDNPIPVTATIVPLNGGIVLVRRKYPPFIDDWCLPGGFIEAHESPEHSAIREVEEETGLKVEIARMLSAHSPGKGINIIILFYLATNVSGNPEAGDDASAVQIFSKETLPKNIAFPLHNEMISKWFDKQVI
jgi:ADP-ribose pyrophosphatase YjhB (NUDIX family)